MTEDSLQADLGRVIASMLRCFRRTSRISQRDLASRLARDQSLVSKVEAGKISLNVVELRRWLAALDVSIADFMNQLDEKLKAGTDPLENDRRESGCPRDFDKQQRPPKTIRDR